MRRKNRPGLGGRIRSSLVIKLNMKFLGRLLAGFLLLNLLLLVLGGFLLAYKVEEGAQAILEAEALGEGYSQGNYSLEEFKKSGTDYELGSFYISWFEKLAGKKLPRGSRYLGLEEEVDRGKTLEAFDSLSYRIEIKLLGKDYLLSYSLGGDLRLAFYFFIFLLIFQLIFLLGSVGKGARSIRKTLRPLEELSETAKSINAQVGAAPMDRELRDLAGAIDSIDTAGLDRPLDLDSPQDELRDLTQAINHMLDRVNASYQSQIRFVSDASHELRTPISVIQGYANLLDRWGKTDEDVLEESIEAIKGESQSMKELVEQLLFLARGDTDSIELHREVFDVSLLVREIVRETELTRPEQKIRLDLEEAFTHADRQLIKQALRILLDNSIKYSSQEDEIKIRVKEDQDQVTISIQDQGIGIQAEDLEKIFQRFYRSDESRARKTGGAGLGLSIAKWIIESHGADFEVLTRVDLGTRVSLIMEAVGIDHQL